MRHLKATLSVLVAVAMSWAAPASAGSGGGFDDCVPPGAGCRISDSVQRITIRNLGPLGISYVDFNLSGILIPSDPYATSSPIVKAAIDLLDLTFASFSSNPPPSGGTAAISATPDGSFPEFASLFRIDFTSFDPGEEFSFLIDMDPLGVPLGLAGVGIPIPPGVVAPWDGLAVSAVSNPPLFSDIFFIPTPSDDDQLPQFRIQVDVNGPRGVPAPMTLSLVGAGLLALARAARKRRSR